MKRSLLAVAAAGVLAAGLLLTTAALANKTITYLTAGSEVTGLHFDIQPGKVIANVCGHAPLQTGGFGEVRCWPTVLLAGAIFTSVNALAVGQALTFWTTQEGL